MKGCRWGDIGILYLAPSTRWLQQGELGQRQEPGGSSESVNEPWGGTKLLCHFFTAFPHGKQGARLEVEEPGHQPSPIWDSSIVGSMPVPRLSIFF